MTRRLEIGDAAAERVFLRRAVRLYDAIGRRDPKRAVLEGFTRRMRRGETFAALTESPGNGGSSWICPGRGPQIAALNCRT